MGLFHSLFAGLLLFVYHCFDRIVINGYLSALTRPENAVYFFHEVLGIRAITKEVPRQRLDDDHHCGRRLRPEAQDSHGLSREGRTQGRLCPVLAPPHGAPRPAWHLLHFQKPGARPDLPLCSAQVSHQRSRLPHLAQTTQPLHALLFFYIRDEVQGPMVL